jgi:hypothetical protein
MITNFIKDILGAIDILYKYGKDNWQWVFPVLWAISEYMGAKGHKGILWFIFHKVRRKK